MSIFRKKVDSLRQPPHDAESTVAPAQPARRADWNWWKIGGITAGSILGIGTISFVGLSLWVSQNLSPTIAKQLTQSLERNVQVGPLQSIGFNEISFGPSRIAATERSASNGSVAGIKIRFDPIALVWQRTLKPDITIESPQIYIDQKDQDLLQKLTQDSKPGFLKTEVQAVRIRQAQGTVVLTGKKQHLEFQGLDLNANFQHRNDTIETVNFDGYGQIDRKSKIAIKGSSAFTQQTTRVELKGQELNAATISGLLQLPAVTFRSGTVDGDLSLDLKPQQPLGLQGTLQVRNATIQIDQVPQLFQQSSGTVQLSSQAVQLQNVSTNYGQVPGMIGGQIDFNKGYDLRAQTATLPIAQVTKTLNLQSPVPLAGQASASLSLTGKLDRPVLAGQVKTTGETQVDRLRFNQVTGNFTVADGRCSFNNIAAFPTLGGALQGDGSISLAAQPQVRFNFQGNRLPADLLTKLYGQSVPVALGLTSISGQVSGMADQFTTDLNITAPQAVYPGSAQLQISPQGTVQIKQAKVQIAGQELVGRGQVGTDRWQLQVQVPAINSQKLVAALPTTTPNTPVQKLPPFLQGVLSGQMLFSGSSKGDSDRLQGQGQLQLQTAAGQLRATRLQLEQGKWQSTLQTNGLQLAKLDPQLAGQLSGQFQVGGSLESFQPATITATGQGAINLGQGKIVGQNLQLAQGKWQGDFSPERLDLTQLNNSPVKGQLSGRFFLNGDLQQLTPTGIQGKGAGILQLPKGQVIARNVQLQNGQWQGEFNSEQLDISQFVPNTRGQLNGKFNLAGSLQNPNPLNIKGTGSGQLRLPQGQVIARNITLERGQWQGEFSPQQVEISQFTPTARGQLTGTFNLAGDLQKPGLNSLRGAGRGQLQLAGGQLVANNLQFQDSNWQSDFSLSAFRVGSLASTLPAPWQTATLTGNFQGSGRLDELTPQQLNLQGNGRLNLGKGFVTAQNLNVSQGQWSGLFGFQDIALQQFPLNLPGNFRTAQLDGQFQLAGQLEKPSLQTAQGTGQLRLPAGKIVAQNLQIANDRWQGQFQTTALPLNQLPLTLPPTLQGAKLTSSLSLGGSIKSFDPKQLIGSGSGQLTLAQGQIQASQWQVANGRWQGAFAAQDLDLPSLTRLLPSNTFSSQLQAGRLQASGQIAGNFERFDPKALNVNAQVKLSGLRVAKLSIEPNLQGSIITKPGESLNLQLAGQRDRLEVSLGANNQPQSFLVQVNQALASGQVRQGELQIKAQNIPVNLVTSFLPPVPQLRNYPLNGLAAGELSINLQTGKIYGKDLIVDQPQIGYITGDVLRSSDFQYSQGILEINNGQFIRGKNEYLLAGRIVTTSPQPEYEIKLDIRQGELADIRSLLQIFSLEDLMNPFGNRNYGRASDLKPSQAGSESQSLQEHIERLSEVKRLQFQERALAQSNPIPDFRKITGDFSGKIVLNNSTRQGSFASFNIQGENWDIDQYNLPQVNLYGKWQNNNLSLGELELKSTTAKIRIAGDFSFDRQDAQITVEKFPLERFSYLFNLPVEVAGDVNMTARLQGSWWNPILTDGQAVLVDGKFNQSDIPVINTNFSYANARFNFDSSGSIPNLAASSAEAAPITMSGSIPYQLPFAFVKPDTNELSFNLTLQNQGMKMIDVLTQQQAIWLGGTGFINLQAKGQLNGQNLTWVSADGKASLQDASIQFSALSDKVTALNSKVIFDFDRIQVDQLVGKYSDGILAAVGSIPINSTLPFSQPATCLGQPANISPTQQPLAVSFDRLQVNLKDKYEGGVSGCVILGQGSITKPAITGEIKLANGKIILPSQGNSSDQAIANNGSGSSDDTSVEFKDLKVVLAENVALEQPGFLSLAANGVLTLAGSADDPKPTGTVNLPSGQFTLFTSRFRLTGNDNVAKFYGDTNAIVSLNLSTKVLETSRLPVTVGNERREQNDTFSTSLGQVQTVQIDAAIKDLPINNLRLDDAEFLRSKPPRGKDEILLLLSNGLGRVAAGEESVGTGLINWAGSALLGGIQSSISDLLGLSDFRLYPSFSQSRGSTTSALGLAGEVGYNLNDNVSVSVFKILTSPELPQYSIRYQIDDRLLLRGSSNLSGDSRALIEFEQRF